MGKLFITLLLLYSMNVMSQSEYVLQSHMQADKSIVGCSAEDINAYMETKGWEFTEHPNISKSDHFDGVHMEIVWDEALRQYVFRVISHANTKILDGDRGKVVDRLRIEMKSITAERCSYMNGYYGEDQMLEWKFRIPKGFQPISKFCHIHQLKAKEGNNGAPLITITLRSDENLANKRVQVSHTGDSRETSRGVLVDNLPFEEFEGEWVQVRTEMHYSEKGTFHIYMERLRDHKVLCDETFTDLDLWRRNAYSIRNKFGIYRSYGQIARKASELKPNGIKDEYLDLADFKAYKKSK